MALLELPLILATCLISQVEKSPAGRAGSENSQVSLKSIQGRYYRGDGLGENVTLIIKLDGAVLYKFSTDDGQRVERKGTAKIVDGTLLFRAEKAGPPLEQSSFPHSELRPVRWGKRSYLLEEDQLLDFCNAINLGLEPRDNMHGPFYVRLLETDRSPAGVNRIHIDGQVEGAPDLPGAWKPFLLATPLHGKVTEVLKEGRATVDIGSEDGLREGMRLFLKGKEEEAGPIRRHHAIVKVVSIEARQCTAEFIRPDFSPEFKRGQEVSSKIPKEILDGEDLSLLRF